MLSLFRWYRRFMGGTWQNGTDVERWGFDAGSMSPAWLDALTDQTLEQRQRRERERIESFRGIARLRGQ